MKRNLSGAALLVVLALGLGAGCSAEPRDEHRQLLVKSRGQEEAFDALTQAIMQRFESTDPEMTSREKGVVATVWRVAEEPNRMVRRRARGTVTRAGGDRDYATVEVAVDRQVSTRKTEFGEIDRQKPNWIGGTDVADSTLELEILRAVKERMKGEVITQ